jgi:hypothetical protein
MAHLTASLSIRRTQKLIYERWVVGKLYSLTSRFLDVAKFTTPTPLSLLISSEFSSPIVGLKRALPTLAVKSPNQILRYRWENIRMNHKWCSIVKMVKKL